MTVNIEYEIDKDFDFDSDKVIKDAVAKAIDYTGFPLQAQINVLVTDNEEIKTINKEYRNIDKATDVLSFPMIEYDAPGDFEFIKDLNPDTDADYFDPQTQEIVLGDIVLSKDKIYEQAAEYGHSVVREMSFLVVHSMLHLFGYDHMDEDDKTMEHLQEDILNDMGITR